MKRKSRRNIIRPGSIRSAHPGYRLAMPGAGRIRLAVEIASGSESTVDLRRKAAQYLRAGASAVLVIYPNARMAAIYDAAGLREVSGDQLLEVPALLPGFSVPVRSLFQ